MRGFFICLACTLLLAACKTAPPVRELPPDPAPRMVRSPVDLYNEGLSLYRQGKKAGKVNYKAVIALFRKAIERDGNLTAANVTP